MILFAMYIHGEILFLFSLVESSTEIRELHRNSQARHPLAQAKLENEVVVCAKINGIMCKGNQAARYGWAAKLGLVAVYNGK
jgi:hypothetical protein